MVQIGKDKQAFGPEGEFAFHFVENLGFLFHSLVALGFSFNLYPVIERNFVFPNLNIDIALLAAEFFFVFKLKFPIRV